jgi:Neocarzinostatin family
MQSSRIVLGVLAAGVAGATLAVSASPARVAGRANVLVSPNKWLRDAQSVSVRVSGFGDGVKVFLSECLAAQYARAPGCGPQTAQQPFLLTDNTGSGTAHFRVHRFASSRPGDTSKAKRCASSCVIFASGINGSHHLVTAAATLGFTSAIALGADGIGSVRFGLSRSRAVSELRRRFGTPSAQGVNTGCSPRYREVAWGDLIAEFRLGRFSGYRYVTAGYALPIPGGPRAPAPNGPTADLTTATGITLASTLAQLRESYRSLAYVGTDRWKAKNGIVFVDGAERDPDPPTSRIIEIKTATCGDY